VSCNRCSSAQLLKQDLQPGEETAVIVNMDTRNFSGVKTITVYVTFDRPQFEEVRLWVQANARDDISVSPDSMAFGTIKRGPEPTSSATVTFLGNPGYQITEAQSESNYVQTNIKELSRTGSEVSYQITAKLRGDAPVGKWYTDVWLKTNSAAMP